MSARILGTAFFAAALGAAPVMAQDRDPYVPAEMPPDSFEGVQYVDSTGCAFIRAGFSGETNWVPRFTRDREPVCGLQPTIAGAGQTRVAETQPSAPEEPAREEAEAPEEPAREEAEASRPAPAPASSAAQVRTVRRPSATATPAHTPEPERTARVTGSGANYCPNYDRIGKAASRSTVPVRCGAQLSHPVDGQRTDGPGGVVWQPGGGERPMPAGYRPVWKDDRLNPNRGRGTQAGEARMRTVWTDTVPRQLVDDSVSAQRPYAAQAQRPSASNKRAAAATPQPAPAATPVGSGDRYVQVGSFGVSSNAANTVARFENMGMPVRTTQVRSGGRTLQVVMIGPFASQADLAAALRAARSAGFSDAFTRG